MDIVQFKQIVFACANQIGGKVIQLHQPSATPNFFAAEISLKGSTVFLLCTHDDDWAFSKNFSPLRCTLQFTEEPAISSALAMLFEIEVLSLDTLQSKYTKSPNHCPSDLKYWKPQTMGEGLFNWWD